MRISFPVLFRRDVTYFIALIHAADKESTGEPSIRAMPILRSELGHALRNLPYLDSQPSARANTAVIERQQRERERCFLPGHSLTPWRLARTPALSSPRLTHPDPGLFTAP
jgi:hypothetical protein